MGGAFIGAQVFQSHGVFASSGTSSIVTRCATLRTMPRICMFAGWTTLWFIFRRPRPSTVRRWVAGRPLGLRGRGILIFPRTISRAVRGGAVAADRVGGGLPAHRELRLVYA